MYKYTLTCTLNHLDDINVSVVKDSRLTFERLHSDDGLSDEALWRLDVRFNDATETTLTQFNTQGQPAAKTTTSLNQSPVVVQDIVKAKKNGVIR